MFRKIRHPRCMKLFSHFRLISQIFDTGFRRNSRSSLFPSHHSLRPRFPQNNGQLGSRQLHPTKHRTWENLWRRQSHKHSQLGSLITEPISAWKVYFRWLPGEISPRNLQSTLSLSHCALKNIFGFLFFFS